MKTKTKIVLAVAISGIIVGGAISFAMFGSYNAKLPNGDDKFAFVRKTHNVQVGDIVAYRYPLEYDKKMSSRDVYISRVVAVPGDIVLIDDGVLYRNNEEVKEEYPISVECRVSVDSVANVDYKTILSKYDVRIVGIINEGKACEFVCTRDVFEEIESAEKNTFSACRMIIDRDDWKDVNVFPTSPFFAWNKDNYGPIYMPVVGDTLNLHPRIAPIYKNIISLFEGSDFQSDTYHVRINQQEAHEYIVTKNYYFILNDDRTMLRDSRMYGPIPDEYIIGKVIN